MYTASNVFSVDPVTGAQLGQAVTMRLTLADAAGRQCILLLRCSMTLTPASRRQLIARDRSARARAVLVARTVPLAGAGLALAVLLTGIPLARPRHSGQRGPQQPGQQEPGGEAGAGGAGPARAWPRAARGTGGPGHRGDGAVPPPYVLIRVRRAGGAGPAVRQATRLTIDSLKTRS